MYVVATPIGNLEDVSARALRVLGEVLAIAAEDTRVTSRLLTRAGYGGPGFTFLGYLPRKPGEMRRLFDSLREDPRPAVAFESPFRIHKALALLAETLPERSLTLTRELTKLHEEVLRGTASQVLAALGERARGEFTLVISGQDRFHQA